MTNSTRSKIAFFRRELSKVYDKHSSITVERAMVILDQIEAGEKSSALFTTVQGHLESAQRIAGIWERV